jgi:hypothetical protein
MCKMFSCVVEKSGRTTWDSEIDSHEGLLKKAGLQDKETDAEKMMFARVEITPKERYDEPIDEWELKIDQSITPLWWSKKHEKEARHALKMFAKKVFFVDWIGEVKSGRIFVFGSSTVTAYDSSTVTAYDSSTVHKNNSIYHNEKTKKRIAFVKDGEII